MKMVKRISALVLGVGFVCGAAACGGDDNAETKKYIKDLTAEQNVTNVLTAIDGVQAMNVSLDLEMSMPVTEYDYETEEMVTMDVAVEISADGLVTLEEVGVNAKLEMEVESAGQSVEMMLYLVDGDVYMGMEVPSYGTMYELLAEDIWTDLENEIKDEFGTPEHATIYETLMMALSEIDWTEVLGALEEIDAMNIPFMPVLKKGSTKMYYEMDYKPYYDKTSTFMKNMTTETTAKDMIDFLLGMLYEDLTVDGILNAIVPLGDLKVSTMVGYLENILEANGVTLQQAKDFLLANEMVQGALSKLGDKMLTKIQQVTVEELLTEFGEYTLNGLLEEYYGAGATFAAFAQMAKENLSEPLFEDATELAEMKADISMVKINALNYQYGVKYSGEKLSGLFVAMEYDFEMQGENGKENPTLDFEFSISNFSTKKATISLPSDLRENLA